MREFEGPRKYREAAKSARREAWTALANAYEVSGLIATAKNVALYGIHPTVMLDSPKAVKKYWELIKAHEAYELLYTAETEVNYERAKRMRERAFQLLDLNQHVPAATGPASST